MRNFRRLWGPSLGLSRVHVNQFETLHNYKAPVSLPYQVRSLSSIFQASRFKKCIVTVSMAQGLRR